MPTAVTPRPSRSAPSRSAARASATPMTPRPSTSWPTTSLRSHIAAMLSAVFPEGEDFFVRSVRNYRDQITDPVLKEQVKGFIGQEALHGREHRAFNERLQELGYPTRFTDKRVKIGLGIFSKIAPKRTQLASPPGSSTTPPPSPRRCSATTRARAEFAHRRDPHAVLLARARGDRAQVRGLRRVPARVRRPAGCASARCTASTSASCSAWSLSGRPSRCCSTGTPAVTRSRCSAASAACAPTCSSSPRCSAGCSDYHRADFHPDDHDTVELLDHWRARS